MKNIILAILFLASSGSHADQLLETFHVSRTFAEGDSTGGFYTQEDLSECKWGLMYIDLSKESGKANFALVLTAKTANQPIVRIDYTVSSSGTCSATGIHTM